jgi:hypothetical protein
VWLCLVIDLEPSEAAIIARIGGQMRQGWGGGMTSSAAEEETFILSDEIIDLISNFFPPPDNHHEKTNQACRALQAVINVNGMVLCQIECPDCRELTMKAVESSFAQMLAGLIPLGRQVHEMKHEGHR